MYATWTIEVAGEGSPSSSFPGTSCLLPALEGETPDLERLFRVMLICLPRLLRAGGPGRQHPVNPLRDWLCFSRIASETGVYLKAKSDLAPGRLSAPPTL